MTPKITDSCSERIFEGLEVLADLPDLEETDSRIIKVAESPISLLTERGSSLDLDGERVSLLPSTEDVFGDLGAPLAHYLAPQGTQPPSIDSYSTESNWRSTLGSLESTLDQTDSVTGDLPDCEIEMQTLESDDSLSDVDNDHPSPSSKVSSISSASSSSTSEPSLEDKRVLGKRKPASEIEEEESSDDAKPAASKKRGRDRKGEDIPGMEDAVAVCINDPNQSRRAVADRFGVSRDTLKRRLAKLGVPVPKTGGKIKKPKNLEMALNELRENPNLLVRPLARKHGVRAETLRLKALKLGIITPKQAAPKSRKLRHSAKSD
jgi:hypothetical protein